MAEIFNEKNFNGEIFTKYVQSLESVKKKELLRSKAIVRRQDIAPMFSEQNGGNYDDNKYDEAIGKLWKALQISIPRSTAMNGTMKPLRSSSLHRWAGEDTSKDVP